MDQVKITMLGTAATRPTQHRVCSGALVQIGAINILVDCGEGVQQRLLQAGIGPGALDCVLITHMHTDHYLGLAGLIGSAQLDDANVPVYCLDENISRLKTYLKGCQSHADIHALDDLKLNADWRVKTVRADHTVPTASLVFSEKDQPRHLDAARAQEDGVPNGPLLGKLARGEDVTVGGRTYHGADYLGPARPGRKIVFSSDTRPNGELTSAAAGASVLIHEATYPHTEANKAHTNGHSTARQAGETAQLAQVENLVLTHIGTRVPARELLKEAKSAYTGSVLLARDGDQIELEGV